MASCASTGPACVSDLSLTVDGESLLRMGMAVLCGLLVGMNRAHHGNTPHPNRVRVHVLVGLSACLLVLAAGADVEARSRAIQGVATGVGFLGAGEILGPNRAVRHAPPEVKGLTSAASIWFTAALGVTVAASTPVLAGVALLLALITLSNRRSEVNGDTPMQETRAHEARAHESRAHETRAGKSRVGAGSRVQKRKR